MNPRSLEKLCDRLQRQGLTARHAERVADELSDHFESLCEEYVQAGHSREEAARRAAERLGDEDALIAEFVRRLDRQPHMRSWQAACFLIAPPTATILLATICAGVGIGLYRAITDFLHVDPMNPLLRGAVNGSFLVLAYALTPGFALACCEVASRYRMPFYFALSSALLLSALGGFVRLDLVQCVASGHVAYFQRFGLDAARLTLPVTVFTLHTAVGWLRNSHRRRLSAA